MRVTSRWLPQSLASAVPRSIAAWLNMAFRLAGTGQLVLGVSIRSILLGLLTILFVQLVAHTQFYATSLVVAGLTAMVIADLARCIGRADRRVERFIDSLRAGDADVPLITDPRR